MVQGEAVKGKGQRAADKAGEEAKAGAGAKASPKKPAAGPAAPPKAGKEDKEDLLSFVERPLRAWWPFIRSDLKGYYLSLLKLSILRILFLLLAAVAGFLVIYGTLSVLGSQLSSVGFWPAFAVVAFILILFALAYFCIDRTFDSAAIMLTARRVEKQPFSMRGSLWQLKGASSRFALLDIAIRLLIALPGIILIGVFLFLLFQPSGSSISSPTQSSGVSSTLSFFTFAAVYMVFWLYMVAAGLAYTFGLQFWMYGFALEGKGVVASFHRAVSLIRSRFAETLAFDFVLILIYILFSLPILALYGIAYLGFFIAEFALLASPSWGLAIFLGFVLIFLALAVLLRTLSEAGWRSAHYLFWRKIAGKEK